MAQHDRRGASMLGMVIFFGAVVTIGVIAYHSLWRSASRNLFSIQENRELLSLARSSLAEAYYQLQIDLDQSAQKWFDWCTTAGPVPAETFSPQTTRQNAEAMSSNPDILAYTTSDVAVGRIVHLDSSSDGGAMGIVDLRVEVDVRRSSPVHEARLVMVERRNFWLADDMGPFGSSGRHVEVSLTPVATAIEER